MIQTLTPPWWTANLMVRQGESKTGWKDDKEVGKVKEGASRVINVDKTRQP